MHMRLTWITTTGLLCPANREVLTVYRDSDLLLVRWSHTVVGDAFIVLSLLPLDLCDI